ncbi:hypothetical protein OG885_43760 [Streptomyces sp. NBC_00028]
MTRDTPGPALHRGDAVRAQDPNRAEVTVFNVLAEAQAAAHS